MEGVVSGTGANGPWNPLHSTLSHIERERERESVCVSGSGSGSGSHDTNVGRQAYHNG